ncbi:Atrial natriuretic peptide receptor 1 [Plakobranchus ocellatus]|uniref:guanylate cyclase n=1 Tax=Plakobranchus ocellatus TaxID=259542 RepID=A0AAV3YW39_9GAST|nr:Atrial natriuretic peptide receptor 1 [Plakobranchus ocellatus]
MFRALSLMLIPLVALTALACYWMVINVLERELIEDQKSQISRGQSVAGVAYALQRERASVVFALQEGNATLLGDQFRFTDKTLGDVTAESSCFFDKQKVLLDLAEHREGVLQNLFSNRTQDEVNYYSAFTQCILEDLLGLAKDMKHGELWQDYVSFKMLLQATESAGMLLSLGIAYFETGFLALDDYLLLKREDVRLAEYLDIAALFSPFTRNRLTTLNSTRPEVLSVMGSFRQLWKINSYPDAGPEKGKEYHEAVTQYFNLLVDLTQIVAQKVLDDADDLIAIALNMVTVACLVFIFVLVMTPVLIVMMHMLTSSIQNYATEASQKSEQLKLEKARSDSLLYQMLPKSVAQQLKMNQSVTLCFSDIVGFTNIAAASTPLQVVVLLNTLYQVFDETLDHYDVYKVETIGDAYMVVSGLPQRNGDLHVIEISLMALELLRVTREFVIPHMREKLIQLRVGCHSGSAVAGVVGTKMPRYCLFGDSVNTASRMESHSLPSCIHISSFTNELLQRFGGFTTERRGLVDIKGKGIMETFFLRSTTREFRTSTREIFHKISLQHPECLILNTRDLEHVSDGSSIKSNNKHVAWSEEGNNCLV